MAVDGHGDLYIADSYNQRIRRVEAATGVITTVAGNGTAGFAGDGGAATSAELDVPYGVAVDGLGDLYIADEDNNCIRRVDATTGIITTVAGNGTAGFSGDGGAATSAQLDGPTGVSFDGLGDVYIADQTNQRIRRVEVTTGIITTVAGTGTTGGSGDGGAATSAQLSFPFGVAVDRLGDLYVTDENNRIRRIDAASGIITTVAGTGTAGFDGDGGAATSAQLDEPTGVAFDGLGDLYFSDSFHIRRVDPAGIITTVAGALDPVGVGPVAQAQLADPRALVVSSPLTLVAGGSSGTVEVVRSDTAQLEVVAGRYPQTNPTGALARFRDSSFGSVSGVAYDAAAGLIYLTESSANRVDVVTIVDPADDTTWTIAVLAGDALGNPGPADGAAPAARFDNPTGLALDSTAHVLYVADAGNHIIRTIDLAANTVSTIVGTLQVAGFSGDGGDASRAHARRPAGDHGVRERRPVHRRHQQQPRAPRHGRHPRDLDRARRRRGVDGRRRCTRVELPGERAARTSVR